MSLSEKKKVMLKWTDSAGYDLVATDKIKSARNDDDLKEVLSGHRRWLEDLLADTLSSVDNLERKLFY